MSGFKPTGPSPQAIRRSRARAFARQLGVDPDELVAAAEAVWSNMNPQTVSYDRALSIAGVALRAAQAVMPRSEQS